MHRKIWPVPIAEIMLEREMRRHPLDLGHPDVRKAFARAMTASIFQPSPIMLRLGMYE